VSEKILFVDDDSNLLASYQRQLRGQYTVDTSSNGQEGLESIFHRGPYAIVISDYRMPGMDGVTFLSRVREASPDTVRMLLTQYADLQTAIEAVNKGNIFRLLTKPCPPDALANALAAGFNQYRLVIAERERVEKEKASLEEQLHQAQKMEAIGTLAGGIAHDFNNILTAILGYAELASLDLLGDSRAKDHLQQSIKAAHRAKELVLQILTFSRQGKQERKPLNIKPIIKEALKFLRASLPSTIEIRQDIEEDLGTIEADPTQVQQVLMNLCTNAAHAMGENGGVLGVSLSKWNVDGETSAATAGIEADPYLRLRVSDTGHGMPPEILKKIFEPYFTTKEVGKGTGLGLAVVQQICLALGWDIVYVPIVYKGAVFRLSRLILSSKPG
jgi:signal transduction histidine kinase